MGWVGLGWEKGRDVRMTDLLRALLGVSLLLR